MSATATASAKSAAFMVCAQVYHSANVYMQWAPAAYSNAQSSMRCPSSLRKPQDEHKPARTDFLASEPQVTLVSVLRTQIKALAMPRFALAHQRAVHRRRQSRPGLLRQEFLAPTTRISGAASIMRPMIK